MYDSLNYKIKIELRIEIKETNAKVRFSLYLSHDYNNKNQTNKQKSKYIFIKKKKLTLLAGTSNHFIENDKRKNNNKTCLKAYMLWCGAKLISTGTK